MEFVTHLLSDESISSTASQATLASGLVAPYFFDAANAASTADDVSGRASYNLVDKVLPLVLVDTMENPSAAAAM